MIDSETKIIALLGNPVEHSFSPQIMNAAFEAENLNFSYIALRTDNIGQAIKGARSMHFHGLSITIPHKIEAMKFVDEKDCLADNIGAINTVVINNGKLKGFNTDCFGAVNSIERKMKVAGKTAIVLGCGGAGRAIAYGLMERKANVTLVDKDFNKAKSVASRFEAKCETGQSFSIKAAPLEELPKIFSEKPDIFVNATPVGMHPKTAEMPIDTKLLKNTQLVFDAIYNPHETTLIKAAKSAGCSIVTGDEMLLEQGAMQFWLWTGRMAPRKVMEQALQKIYEGKT